MPSWDLSVETGQFVRLEEEKADFYNVPFQ